MRINDRKHIGERGQRGVDPFLAARLPAHTCNEALLVISIAIKTERVILPDYMEKLRKNRRFTLAVVRPKGMALDALAIANDEADQISEAVFGIPFHIHVDAHRRGRQLGLPQYIDGAVADRERMQRVIAPRERRICPLAAAPGPKGMRKLSEREHALAGVAFDGLFTKAAQ